MGGWGNISIWVRGMPLDMWLCPFSRRARPVELVFRHLATQNSRPFCPVSTSPLSWKVRQLSHHFHYFKKMEMLKNCKFSVIIIKWQNPQLVVGLYTLTSRSEILHSYRDVIHYGWRAAHFRLLLVANDQQKKTHCASSSMKSLLVPTATLQELEISLFLILPPLSDLK